MIKNLRCPTCGNKRKRRHQARAYACAPFVGDPHLPLERGDFHLNSIGRLRGYFKRSAGGSKEKVLKRLLGTRTHNAVKAAPRKEYIKMQDSFLETLWTKAKKTLFPPMRKGIQ